MVADRDGEIWGIKSSGQVIQIVNNTEIVKSETNVATQIAVSAKGTVWITASEALRAKGIYLMYYDFHNQKFETEKKAHFYCKYLAVLPNGVPIVVTENGDLYLLINKSKFFGGASDGSTEMVRVVEPTGSIKIRSVSVASGVDPDHATWDQMTVWGISDLYNEEARGYVVYSGYFDISSGDPVINWQNTNEIHFEKVSLFSEGFALGLNSDGQVYALRT